MSYRLVYDVYDNDTDEPLVISGSAVQCAKVLGISVKSFREYSRRKNNVKRTVIVYMKCDNRNVFGSRLRNARFKARMTQSEVADKCGIALSTLKGYEQGKRLPDIEIAQRLAVCLSVPIKYLSGGFK